MSVDPSTRERVLTAAGKRFAKFGYHGTSMRDVANDVGIRVSGLYNHFQSKEELLFEFLRDATVALRDAVQDSQANVCDRQQCRLMAFVEAQVFFDLANRDATIVNNHEFRHLEPPYREDLVEVRDEIEALISQIVAPEGPSPSSHVRINAIMSVSRGVAEWYKPDGTWDAETLAREQALLAVRLIGSDLPSAHRACRIGARAKARASHA